MTEKPDLARIVRELRDANEGYLISKDLDADHRERTWQAADDLSDAVTQLESYLDDYGPDELTSPYVSRRGWVGYAPLDGTPRSSRRRWWSWLTRRSPATSKT